MQDFDGRVNTVEKISVPITARTRGQYLVYRRNLAGDVRLILPLSHSSMYTLDCGGVFAAASGEYLVHWY